MQTIRIQEMFRSFLFLLCAAAVSCGSLCPPRSTIYPCSCANVRQSKRVVHTVVTCHRIVDSDSLHDIYPGLRSLDIDQFHLYDSFWGSPESERVLPSDWFTLLKIREMEIVDSMLDSCFACRWRLNCRNSLMTRFVVSNSSTSDKICSFCGGDANPRASVVAKPASWTGCLTRLREFRFSGGRLASFGADFFPVAMRNLTTLDLSRNRIVKVDPNALKNLPALKTLDLSRNAIEFIDHMFAGQVTRLEVLDVSWNSVKEIGADLFSSLPRLRTFRAGNNVISDMRESEWKNMPETLHYIDLGGNPLVCDCGVRWVNATFGVNVDLRGSCSDPPDYSRSPLRRASRLLTQRCTEEGVLGTRAPKSRGAASGSTDEAAPTTPAPKNGRRQAGRRV